MDNYINKMPHKNPLYYDQYAVPIQKQDANNVFPDSKMTQSNYMEVQIPFPMDIQQKQIPQDYNEQEQNFIRVSINMNPFAFVQPEMFKSANIDFRDSPHLTACILVFIFKLIILFLYLAIPYLEKQILIFELIIISSMVDFWIVKNYCGRRLTGLLWWVDIDENGKEQWVFETRLGTVNELTKQRIHYRLFWFTQLFMAFMFFGIMIANLFTSQINLAISLCVPTVSTIINLWAFNMCNKVKKSRMGQYMMAMSIGNNRRSVIMPLKL